MSEKFCNGYSKYYSRWGDPTEELHSAYDSWLEDMSGREGAQFVPFEYDLNSFDIFSLYFKSSVILNPSSKRKSMFFMFSS